MDKLNKDEIKAEMMEVFANYQDMLLILKEIATDHIIDNTYEKGVNSKFEQYLHEGVVGQIAVIMQKHMKFPLDS